MRNDFENFASDAVALIKSAPGLHNVHVTLTRNKGRGEFWFELRADVTGPGESRALYNIGRKLAEDYPLVLFKEEAGYMKLAVHGGSVDTSNWPKDTIYGSAASERKMWEDKLGFRDLWRGPEDAGDSIEIQVEGPMPDVRGNDSDNYRDARIWFVKTAKLNEDWIENIEFLRTPRTFLYYLSIPKAEYEKLRKKFNATAESSMNRAVAAVTATIQAAKATIELTAGGITQKALDKIDLENTLYHGVPVTKCVYDATDWGGKVEKEIFRNGFDGQECYLGYSPSKDKFYMAVEGNPYHEEQGEMGDDDWEPAGPGEMECGVGEITVQGGRATVKRFRQTPGPFYTNRFGPNGFKELKQAVPDLLHVRLD